jgi:mitochondrial fission protein ELM1
MTGTAQAMAGEAHTPGAIWVLSDGKAGHLNQSLGLAEALLRLRPGGTIRELPARRGDLLRAGLPGRAPAAPPALLLGAGHATHGSLVYWRRRTRRPAIVLMRPSLPMGLFDLCVVPRHDGVAERPRCWLSDGPLNRVRPAAEREDHGVILLGGPSPHFTWDSAAILEQLTRVCARGAWRLSTSRRTPPALLAQIQECRLPGLEARSFADWPAGWLAAELARARHCWVTPDSASMVYEALTGACAVGLFDLVAAPGSRVAAGVRELVQRGLCIDHAAFLRGVQPSPPAAAFAEADRIAARLVDEGWYP